MNLRMENELGAFQKMHVPDRDNSVGFVEGSRIFVIGCTSKFGVLWSPRSNDLSAGKV